MIAVVHLDGGQAGEICIKQIDPRIIPGSVCTAQPSLAKPFQNWPRQKLSFLALLLMVSFFSSMSYQPETDRMAAGIATPLLRNSMARLTARLPPIDWPVTATFSARIPFARSQ